MKKYNPTAIETKWQKIWQETGIYKTSAEPNKKFYNLVMFPYPSGDLHIGHWYNFAPADTFARFKKMNGCDVLEPIGFDAFGLPAENAAIKRNLAADDWTEKNITNMVKQLKSIGAMYDWSKSINTSKPEYYRWTQWLFLTMFEKGMAYQKEGLVNWCPSCKTVLANEQVIQGKCERCDSEVKRKNLKQWYLKITEYAQSLLDGLDELDWPDDVKQMQKNWIGKSEGASLTFAIGGTDLSLEVFTTRADTIFGTTFVVISPEHSLVRQITKPDKAKEVGKYIEQAGKKTDVDRMGQGDKTGVFTGSYASNPANGEQIPIWVSDYVLMGYGTGAIMSVPAHDERDFEFAKKFGLEIRQVISGDQLPHTSDGLLINSGKFNGLTVDEARQSITKWLESKKVGKSKIEYKLRDWLISRQRYWGAPIPIIHCSKCGVVPVPRKDLPVILPLKQKFDKTGRSPLLSHPDFIEVTCPKCEGKATREKDTMDTFVDSSWYFLHYPNPDYRDGPFDPSAVAEWLPVDLYIGGREHAVMHLLYARFFSQFLFAQKLIKFKEPFKKLVNQGTILGPDGNKMSKSKGNVIDPDEYVKKYGADSVRLYLMFMGPYEDGGPWDPGRFEGTHRFTGKIWGIFTQKYQPLQVDSAKEVELIKLLHKTIKKVTFDLENIKFNTAISAMMEFINLLNKTINQKSISKEVFLQIKLNLNLLLAPFAPHFSEELWEMLGNKESVHLELWPKYNEKLARDDLVTIVVQLNGKAKSEMVVEANVDKAKLEEKVMELNEQKGFAPTDEIVKVVVVPNRIVNLVTIQKK